MSREHDWFRHSVQQLRGAGIDDPAREAARIWQAVTGQRWSAWLVHPQDISEDMLETLHDFTVRRSRREPFAYLVGTQPFLDMDLQVGPGVLIPRPETQRLVEAVCARLPHEQALRIVDVGTGSGAIALGLCRCGGRLWQITGVDKSREALNWARRNQRRYVCAVSWQDSDLLEALPAEPLDAIVANLPYIDRQEGGGDPELAYEPPQALYAQQHGLSEIFRLADQAYPRLKKGGLLALELGQGQAGSVKAYLTHKGFVQVEGLFDCRQIERIVLARRNP
ncbi:MAG: peptide chain release factor N(5)-glutamine methyltransferase [Firmicutes bacterium]|nr:peptide chain release factor N(5)-glutamine methyltransferase [Bacillota bacterium]